MDGNESVRDEFERIVKDRFPTADLRRSDTDEGYMNQYITWAYWGYLQRVVTQ